VFRQRGRRKEQTIERLYKKKKPCLDGGFPAKLALQHTLLNRTTFFEQRIGLLLQNKNGQPTAWLPVRS
jgi:hypothetical protein